jgi:hypothetical protein
MIHMYRCPGCGNLISVEFDGTAGGLARAAGKHQRTDQGLPEFLEDPAIIERLAALVAPRIR